jgi:hypothetical protein
MEEVNIMEDEAVTCREQLYRLNKPNVEQLCPVEWRASVLLHHKDGVVEALHLQEAVHVCQEDGQVGGPGPVRNHQGYQWKGVGGVEREAGSTRRAAYVRKLGRRIGEGKKGFLVFQGGNKIFDIPVT